MSPCWKVYVLVYFGKHSLGLCGWKPQLRWEKHLGGLSATHWCADRVHSVPHSCCCCWSWEGCIQELACPLPNIVFHCFPILHFRVQPHSRFSQSHRVGGVCWWRETTTVSIKQDMQTMMQWMEGQVCAPLDLMTVKFSSGRSQEQGQCQV